jgi:hypothetical protein
MITVLRLAAEAGAGVEAGGAAVHAVAGNAAPGQGVRRTAVGVMAT